MDLRKKNILGLIFILIAVVFVSLPILLPQSQQKQNPIATTGPEENPRIKEIIQLTAEKKYSYQNQSKRLDEFYQTTNISCAVYNTSDCVKLIEQLAEDEQITNVLKKIYEDGSIQILVFPTITPIGARRIYIDDIGNLIIEDGASFGEIRKFLGLKPKDN